MVKRWTVGQSHFPGCAEGPSCETEGFPGKNFKMSKYSNPDHEGWHLDTEFACDLKTILSSDTRMKTGREYRGVLKRDSDAVVDEFLYRDAHFTFIETLPPAACRRNPRLFDGKYVTLTRWNDGTIRLYFKKLRTDDDFTVDGYALAVCNEIRLALKGLVKE